MHAIDDLGILKMDLLGLKNLTILEDALARIYKVHNESVELANIPYDDAKTFKLFQKAQVVPKVRYSKLEIVFVVKNSQ